MDTYLAIASKRDVRAYAETPIPDDVVHRILDAGRLAGSSRNRQERELVVVSDREALAAAVFAPENVLGAALVVAIAGSAGGFDMGRAAQNMMLAAWNDGVVSCPSGQRDPDAVADECRSGFPALSAAGRGTCGDGDRFALAIGIEVNAQGELL